MSQSDFIFRIIVYHVASLYFPFWERKQKRLYILIIREFMYLLSYFFFLLFVMLLLVFQNNKTLSSKEQRICHGACVSFEREREREREKERNNNYTL